MNSKRHPTPLGELEMLVLLAVQRLDEDAYGIRVLDELDRTAKRRLTRGTIYATLQRLEDKGLLDSRLGEATAQRGGRAKRYYRVNEKGLAALRRGVGAIRALSEGLEGTLS